MSMPKPQIAPDPALAEVARRYAVAITPTMASLIETATDPIGAQFLPDARELITTPEELADPIGDHAHSPTPWIVHRYADRLLLKLTHVCPVYCRFCFRREMVGPGKARGLKPAALDAALDYIRAQPKVWEVILTGGDPFVISARRAKAVTQALAAIEHVQVLRWHTRVPVVAPERVTPAFVRALKAPGKAVYVALHANHAREFTAQARAAIARLVDAGIPMVSQTVLLKGVNDTPAALEDLMRAFVVNRIKPYYLHHGDLAPGTGHFRTSIAQGQALIRTLKINASGLCQPTYVLDIPGGHGKAPLTPSHWRDGDVLDDAGCWRTYPPPE
jgi:lysine 2,3-aminomutase